MGVCWLLCLWVPRVGGSTPISSSFFGASDARQPQGWGSALSPLGILCLGCPCVAVPAMAGLGTVTPRAKRPRREGSRDLGLSATKAGARRRAKSRQREGDRGECCPLQGWDPWEHVPCPPLTPVTPRKGRLVKLRLEGECRRLRSAPLCPRERGECVSPLLLGMEALPQAVLMGPLCPTEPTSPPLQPCYEGTYFSGLPTDECPDPAAPSL